MQSPTKFGATTELKRISKNGGGGGTRHDIEWGFRQRRPPQWRRCLRLDCRDNVSFVKVTPFVDPPLRSRKMPHYGYQRRAAENPKPIPNRPCRWCATLKGAERQTTSKNLQLMVRRVQSTFQIEYLGIARRDLGMQRCQVFVMCSLNVVADAGFYNNRSNK